MLKVLFVCARLCGFLGFIPMSQGLQASSVLRRNLNSSLQQISLGSAAECLQRVRPVVLWVFLQVTMTVHAGYSEVFSWGLKGVSDDLVTPWMRD